MSQLFNYNGRWVNFEMLNKLKKQALSDEAVEEKEEVKVEEEVKEEAKEAFCDFCDSKGVRHKKECPLDK